MYLLQKIHKKDEEKILTSFITDILIEHGSRTEDELIKIFKEKIDEYNLWERFKKECPKMKKHPKIKYYMDYQDELKRLHEKSRQPKTYKIRTLIKTDFNRWFLNIETRGYRGKRLPFNTLTQLIIKDYVVEGDDIVNLHYQWKDCKYKETTSN